jgi:hypothetical protein
MKKDLLYTKWEEKKNLLINTRNYVKNIH